jgi:hypothetical protein
MRGGYQVELEAFMHLGCRFFLPLLETEEEHA